MKLSPETLEILKNFSVINNGIQFKKGNILKTVSPAVNVLALAELKDEFEQNFCVYDLSNFLNVQSLYKDVDISFKGDNIILKSGRSVTQYRMANPATIQLPPEKNISIGDPDSSFVLSKEDYELILKTSSVLSSPNIAFSSDGETIEVVCYDAVDNSANINSTTLSDGNGKKFNCVLKTDNLKMIVGSYDVGISFKGPVHFKNKNSKVEYWVMSESNSVFDK